MYPKTYIHEASDGRKIEYRRVPGNWAAVLESRILRPDGTPFDDQWYRVPDTERLWLELDGGGEILAQLQYAI